MHAAAHAAVEAAGAHEDFRQQSEQQEVFGAGRRRGAFEVGVDGAKQARRLWCASMMAATRSGGRLRDRRQALGDELAVAAMAAKDLVFGLERQRLADRGALLAEREMRGAFVGVGDVGIGAFGLERGEHRLELAHDQHVAQHLAQRRIAAGGALVGEGGGVGAQGDFGEGQAAGPAQGHRIDGERFGHGTFQTGEHGAERHAQG